MNSASVGNPTTVGWNFDLYAIVPPASLIHVPLNDQWVLTHVAQSKSAYAWRTFASYSGHSSNRRSCLLLLIRGIIPSLNSMRGAVLQK